jgi:2-polyprenyl-6-methoxyphenol hydroxylase-like FAD-dependent oxidoreductase
MAGKKSCGLLIGADGPGSTVRQQLLPRAIGYAGYVAWQGVVVETKPLIRCRVCRPFHFFQAPHTHPLLPYPRLDGSLVPGRRRLN